jgi:hypothetical protein
VDDGHQIMLACVKLVYDGAEVSLAVNGQVYRKHDEFSLSTRPDPPQPALQRLLGTPTLRDE